MVYLSFPTEKGTLYSKRELREISEVCKRYGMYLFVDGARMGYGLGSERNDLTLRDFAELCDVFYIGGTKVGALFGEAVVIANPRLQEDFRYLIKLHGGMLAKGRLLGIQFEVLMEDGLYFEIAARADALADRIRSALDRAGFPLLYPGVTNQIFAVFPDRVLEELEKRYVFCPDRRVDEGHRAVRICTSWATREEAVEELCRDIEKFTGR